MGREASCIDQPFRSQQILCVVVNVSIGLTSAAAAAASVMVVAPCADWDGRHMSFVGRVSQMSL